MCWCFVLIHYQLKFIYIVWFVSRYNGANVIWHSGPIVEVLAPHRVKTKSSSEYVLVGKLDFETAITKGTYFKRSRTILVFLYSSSSLLTCFFCF